MHDTATAMLRDEHRLIIEVAGTLERLLDEGAADLDSVAECVRFFRLFADACHHGKEEDLLFPALGEQGMPSDSGPIAVMLHEHRIGREFVRRMAAALDADPVPLEELEGAGRGYIELIRVHIAKEDGVLFQMADGIITGPACRDLCSAYDEVCARRFEGKTLADLEGMAETLRGRYPAS